MGGGGEQTTSTSGPPAWAQPYYEANLSRAGQIANLPYQGYNQARVADFTVPQQIGMDRAIDRSIQGNPLTGQAQSALSSQIGSKGSGQIGALGQNPYIGQQSGNIDAFGSNPFMGQKSGEVSATSNPYFNQNNPYLQSQIDKSQQDIIRGFNKATNNTDATFARAGAFGGSAWQQQNDENSRNLAQQLGDTSNQFRFQDYGLQSQLGESAANRGLQAQQFNVGTNQSDISRNAGLYGQQQAQDLARQQFNVNTNQSDIGRNANLYGQQQAQDLARQQFNIGTNQSDAARNLQAIGMAPGLAQSDYFDINQMIGIGGQMQQQNQGLLSDAYSRFQDAQNYPLRGQQVMNDALGRISGGTSTQTAPGADPFSQLLGLGLTAAQLGAFSDRRLKTDIKRVGQTNSGLPIYTYRYKWGGPVIMGVMADEVKETIPSAVTQHVSGFDMVNYGAI